jgi:hypothetical protein
VEEVINCYVPAPRFLWKEPDAAVSRLTCAEKYTMLIPADSKDGQRQAWLSDVFLKAFVYHVEIRS